MLSKNGSWEGVEGTSWSSPEYTALQTLINHQRDQRFGQTNSAIYAALENNYSTDFIDITSGDNDGYDCGAGWDAVTGIGTPLGYELGNDMQ